jgi:hypothetical protein
MFTGCVLGPHAIGFFFWIYFFVSRISEGVTRYLDMNIYIWNFSQYSVLATLKPIKFDSFNDNSSYILLTTSNKQHYHSKKS